MLKETWGGGGGVGGRPGGDIKVDKNFEKL